MKFFQTGIIKGGVICFYKESAETERTTPDGYYIPFHDYRLKCSEVDRLEIVIREMRERHMPQMTVEQMAQEYIKWVAPTLVFEEERDAPNLCLNSICWKRTEHDYVQNFAPNWDEAASKVAENKEVMISVAPA